MSRDNKSLKNKSIASRNEIEARQDPKKPDAQIAPIRREQPTSNYPKQATQKQTYLIKRDTDSWYAVGDIA